MFVYGQVIKSSLIQSGFIELVVLHCEKQILTQVPSETHLDILAACIIKKVSTSLKMFDWLLFSVEQQAIVSQPVWDMKLGMFLTTCLAFELNLCAN